MGSRRAGSAEFIPWGPRKGSECPGSWDAGRGTSFWGEGQTQGREGSGLV